MRLGTINGSHEGELLMFQVNDLVRGIGGGYYLVLGFSGPFRRRREWLVLQRVTSGRITTGRNPRMFTLVGHNYKSTVEEAK